LRRLTGHVPRPVAFSGFVQIANGQTAGLEKGWLVIDGGGEPTEVKKRFVSLAGGPDANFVLIPTATGATIQGSFLVRGASGNARNPDGDNTIMMSPGHETGFGLLRNSAIDQHVNTRGREHDLVEVIKKHPELLGIGIDEGAWIEVHGDSFTVFGGQVAIYDAIRYGDKFYFFLSPGEKFDLQCVHVHGAC
jgi:cyanophycinase-like exopeptidase